MATLAIDLPHLREADPIITPGDRLGMTLFVAIVAHAIVILGIVFVPHDASDALRSTLDIVLVQQRSESAPEEADFLAQANQEGWWRTYREKPAGYPVGSTAQRARAKCRRERSDQQTRGPHAPQ